MSDLCSLGKDNFSLISRKLTAFECGKFACVSRACRELVNDDAIWEANFFSEFGNANIKEQNDKYSVFIWLHESSSFHTNSAKYKDLFNAKAIARSLWTKAKNWHNNNDLKLAKGVEAKILDKVESNLGVTLPLDVKEVYRMHNGQRRRSKVREFDIDTIIQKSGVYTSKMAYNPPSKVVGVCIATPIFLDLETVLKHTIELRDHYDQKNRSLNSKKQRKLKKEKKQNGVTDIDIISSSIVYAEISCGPLKQLLLVKCDTHDVYLWQYSSRLIQIPTKSKYGWFAIWLEGLTGFDENENSCQVPLSWYFIRDEYKIVPLLNERCKKAKKQLTLSANDYSNFRYYISDTQHFQFYVCKFSQKDILLSDDCKIYRGLQLCSIASKISKPLMCHVFSRYENDETTHHTRFDTPKWFISIFFESIESSEDLTIDRSQDILQEMIIAEQKEMQKRTLRQNNALLKSKQRKRSSINQSSP